PVERATVDPIARTVRMPSGAELRLATEAARPHPVLAALHPVHDPGDDPIVPHPPIDDPPDVPPVRQARYATRTIVHQESVDVQLPCKDFGAFYMQSTADGDVPVGCQDALKLGQIVYKQYAEIASLRTDKYQVYRSLQQPGRFLVVPAAYR